MDERNIFYQIAQRLNLEVPLIGMDGIKYRGKGPYQLSNGYWSRESGNEKELWHKSDFRYVEITKDLNDDEVWDIRCESGLRPLVPDMQIGCLWYRNLMRWEFLIRNFFEAGLLPEFETLTETALIESFNSSPAARINCKKTVGKGSCPNVVLRSHIKIYGDLIQKQIKDLEGNIHLIGGCSENIILNSIAKRIWPNLQPVESTEGWIYYSADDNVIVINGYNPNPRFKKALDCYNQLRTALINLSNTKEYYLFKSQLSNL